MPRTVLLVDDDPDIRSSVSEAISEQGYTVRSAGSGREALCLLGQDSPPPDLILLDLMMPDLDGWEFCAALRQAPALAAVPVVLFTSHAVSSQTVIELKAAAVIRKPVRLAMLVETLQRVLAEG